MSNQMWSQYLAIELSRSIEAVCQAFGCHVALTGGTLYRDGPRKDADFLFYRIRQVPKIDKEGLWLALAQIGIAHIKGFGWVHKAEYRGLPIDFFFPEEDRHMRLSDDDYAKANAAAPTTAKVEELVF